MSGPWIACSEQLPERLYNDESPMVLTFRPESRETRKITVMCVCAMDGGPYWHDDNNVFNEMETVTHWMPLPEPPK